MQPERMVAQKGSLKHVLLDKAAANVQGHVAIPKLLENKVQGVNLPCVHAEPVFLTEIGNLTPTFDDLYSHGQDA